MDLLMTAGIEFSSCPSVKIFFEIILRMLQQTDLFLFKTTDIMISAIINSIF